MMIWIDTSAIIAVLCKEDHFHDQAKTTWFELLDKYEIISCNNYTLLETVSLIQKRHGMSILRAFQHDMMPILNITWLSETEHHSAMQSLLVYNRRNLSLVDCASFETMRRLDIKKAFTFDKHFSEQGFEVMPQL